MRQNVRQNVRQNEAYEAMDKVDFMFLSAKLVESLLL